MSSFLPQRAAALVDRAKTRLGFGKYLEGASEELAGRGLYGDYVLLFPKELIDKGFALDKVEDVLLRVDYLSIDNLPDLERLESSREDQP